jgi:hypothetical protein
LRIRHSHRRCAIHFTGCESFDALDRDHIAVGAPIDGRATPIAYPLAGGRLPEPIPFPEVGTHRALGRATEIGIFPKHARR